MNYDYVESQNFCEKIGLRWLGDDFVRVADHAAYETGFTQHQVNIAMQHHLWQVRWLFCANNYSLWQRILLALHFLLGREV